MKKYHVTLLVLLALAATITVGCGVSAHKATLPTFTKVPFISGRTVSPATSMFLMNLDGSSVTGIATNNGSDWTYSPSISADLKVAAFASDSEIWVTDTNGKTPVQLTNNITNSFYSFYVRVSPDGAKLLYSLYNGTNYHVEVMNPDGTGNVDLTLTPPTGMTDCYDGSFSADSSQVVFSCVGNSISGVFIIKADGTGSTTSVTSGSDFLDGAMFSADGTKILFVDFGNGPSAAAARRKLKPSREHSARPQSVNNLDETVGIVSVNLDGSNQTSVVPNSYEGLILNSSLYYTIYDSNLGFHQIYKSNLDGTNAVSVSDGLSDDYLGLSAD